jgi:hypothetical protein
MRNPAVFAIPLPGIPSAAFAPPRLIKALGGRQGSAYTVPVLSRGGHLESFPGPAGFAAVVDALDLGSFHAERFVGRNAQRATRSITAGAAEIPLQFRNRKSPARWSGRFGELRLSLRVYFILSSQRIPFSNNMFCVGLVKTLSP